MEESSRIIMDDLFYKVQQHIPGVIGDSERFRSAVCIALIPGEEEYEILFEIRSRKIDAQPGDICLPGGAIEAGESPQEAAVRETCEELLISPGQVKVLGPFDVFRAGNVIIYPYVAILEDYRDTYSRDEVSEILRVPLSFFLNARPDVYRIPYQPVFSDDFPFDRIYGGREYKWRKMEQTTYFYQYKDHTIWGFTAMMIHAFTRMLQEG